MNKTCIVILACAFASGAMPALGDESDAPPPSKSPAQQAPEATRPANTSRGQQTPKDEAKQRAVDAATKASSLDTACDHVWDRSWPPYAGKSWEDMTPAEQNAARRAWLCASGDFGAREKKGPAKSLPSTKNK